MSYLPPSPSKGPPLPSSLGIAWPWAKTETVFQETASIEIPEETAKALGLPTFPTIEYGRVKLADKGWRKVMFKTTFKSPPGLVATAQYRERWYEAPKYEAARKTVDVPGIAMITAASAQGVPTRTWEIPRIVRDDMRQVLYDQFHQVAIDTLGDWRWGVRIVTWDVTLDMNWARDRLADAWGVVGWVNGAFMNFFWDSMIQPQIDQTRDTINTAISTQVDDINSSLAYLRDSVNIVTDVQRQATNDALAQFGQNIQGKINESNEWAARQLEDAVNKAILKMYETINLDQGQAMTPVLYRNVTTLGFEVFSLGDMTLDYVAICK